MNKGDGKKYFNAAKTLYSWRASALTGKVINYGMPVSMGIELTNCCNLKCPECVTGSGQMTRPKGYMPVTLFERILEETGPYLFNVNLFFQGEPMMHPEFFVFLEKAEDYNTIVSTNGHFLTPEKSEKLANSGLGKLIVSLDGMDQVTYSIYRNKGEFQKVAEGIKNVSAAIKRSGSTLKLEIQFLVNSKNESQIPAVRKFASGVRARLRLKSMQVLDNERVGEWMPTDEKYRRYRAENGRYISKGRLKNHCLRLWLNPVVTWDGKVVPCCFDKNADHIFGDLNKQSFGEIWQGEKATRFRQSLLDDRRNIEICSNCTTGLSGVKY